MTTRNVWLKASIDGRAAELAGGPRNANGGLSARVLQRENGGIGDHSLAVSSFTTGAGRIVTDARITSNGNSYGRPSLALETHRDRPGVTVTLEVPGLTEASAGVRPGGALADADRRATITFATEAERDAFLSLLPAWREAQAEVSA